MPTATTLMGEPVDEDPTPSTPTAVPDATHTRIPPTPETPISTQTRIPGPDGFLILFLDVGQGDATLIYEEENNLWMLIDGGRSKTRLRDRMKRWGIEDLEAIVATHADADHIAGLIEAFEMFDIEHYYWNGAEHDTQTFKDLAQAVEYEGSEVTVVRRGDVIQFGELDIEVLHPSGLSGDSNADSIVLQVGCGDFEVLLMGDATAKSEASMLAAGLDSQYGHPHLEVLEALEDSTDFRYIIHTDTTEGDDSVVMGTDCEMAIWQSGEIDR